MHVGIVGLGAMGQALALALHEASTPACRLVAVSSRREGAVATVAAQLDGVMAVPTQALAAHVDLVLLTVGDPEVPVCAGDPAWTRGLTVVHTSGALGLRALDAAAARGAAVGSFHPLVPTTRSGIAAWPQGEALSRFENATVALDGTEPVLAQLRGLAEALGARTVVVSDEWRARWHAAATLVGNATSALVALADRMLADLPMEPAERRHAMTGMLSRVAQQLATSDPDEPVARLIAGPVARGDTRTVQRHIAALSVGGQIEHLAAYQHAASLVLLAIDDTLPSEQRADLVTLLTVGLPVERPRNA